MQGQQFSLKSRYANRIESHVGSKQSDGSRKPSGQVIAREVPTPQRSSLSYLDYFTHGCDKTLRSCRADVYDVTMQRFTTKMYESWLDKALPELAQRQTPRVADVGAGTGTSFFRALKSYHTNITSLDFGVDQIDIDPEYVAKAQANIEAYALQHRVRARCADFLKLEEEYDQVLFSDCWAVLPTSIRWQLVEHAFGCLKPQGKVYIVTTLDQENSFRSWIKPNIKYFSGGVDFGVVTTYAEMKAGLEERFSPKSNAQVEIEAIPYSTERLEWPLEHPCCPLLTQCFKFQPYLISIEKK